MDDDIEDYLDCLTGDLKAQAQTLVDSLNNDRQQAQKSRLEARMATTTINQRIHDIAEARWKMLPIAVQREHDILAMDIAELQWHLKQEKIELRKSKQKLDYAKTINRRVKADIDFNKEHSPLVEEKLRLEQTAIHEIKTVQQEKDQSLEVTKMRLDQAEAEYRQKSQSMIAERDQHKSKLDKVLNTLHVLKTDLEKKEADKRFYTERSETARIRIKAQEEEIHDLQTAAEEMRKQERHETTRIEALRAEIRTLDQETFDLDTEREALQEATKTRHEECEQKLGELKKTHKELVSELDDLTRKRDDIRLNNEDSRKRHKVALKNKSKLEKELERLKKQNEDAKTEFETLTKKVRALTNSNNELLQVIERKERQDQAAEDNLASMIDTTKAQIDDEIRIKNDHELKLKADQEELQKQTELLKETKQNMEKYISDLRRTIHDLNGKLVAVKDESVEVQSDLGVVELELEKRTEQNREEIDQLTAEMNKLSVENQIKEQRKNELQTQLNNLITHEKELIQRVKDLKAQQVVLTQKRESVLEAIEGHKETLKIVENDHRIQLEANETMEKRLKEAQNHLAKRRSQFDQMISERETKKQEAIDRLRHEVVKNGELAHQYKVVQAKEMAIKDTLAAFYETRVSLEDTKVWFKSLINMENRYFDTTSNYNSLRDELHKAEFHQLQKTATDHIARVAKIEDSLHEGVAQLTDFLGSVLGGTGREAVQQVARHSMMRNEFVPLDTTFVRSSKLH